MARPKQQITVSHVQIDELKPAAYNPRRHTPEALEQLKESVRKFGLIDPIIANSAPNRRNVVIGGHFRLKVAKELGFSTVPVVYVRIPDMTKEKELNLRLNRNTGEWDFELLKDFDPTFLLDVGFDAEDLSSVWDDALETEDDGFDVDKALAEIKKPKSQPGEMYQLGNHKIICGDSTDPTVVKKLLGKTKVDMLNSDPPFNIGLSYDTGIGGKRHYGGTVDDAKTDADYKQFLKKALVNGLSALKPDAHIFTYCDQKYIWLLQTLYHELGIENKRVCLWIKNNSMPTPQVAFNRQYEPCVYGTIGNPHLSEKVLNLSELMNKEIGTGNRTIEDIYDMIDIWLVKRLNGADYEHPTEKPPTLHEKALRRCTKPGDVALDLFGGSGSLLVSCEQLRRSACLVEREPIFIDLIIRRYEKFSGKKARKIS